MDCQHERLELCGWDRPDGLAEDALWLRDEHLVCLDCEAQLMYMPEDVTRIINIPHPAKEVCFHTHKHYHLCGFGAWACLNCGETGISSPAARLCFSGKPLHQVGINKSTPQTDLNIIGIVGRTIPTSLHPDFGDVWPHGKLKDSFAEHLLRFEGKRVEITVTVLEDAGGGGNG